jgi:HAMP domain-containing protein
LGARVQISHLLPVLFLSLAHLLLDMTGWRGTQVGFTPGTLMLNLGLFLLALIMAWGFALSLVSWVTGPVQRLGELASYLAGRIPTEEWQPAGWEIDSLARRVLSLLRQNRRGIEALVEVEAVRGRVSQLVKGWGELDLPESPGLETKPEQFWRSVRKVLVDRVGNVSERAKNLASRMSKCRESSREISKGLGEATIQTESLFLESSQKAVTHTRKDEQASDSVLQELRSGLERWSGEIQGVMDSDASAKVNAWRDWILHLLEERGDQPRGEVGLEARLEALSRRMETLARRGDDLSTDVEACRILSMEIHGALSALSEEEPLVHA